jgi:hypothetical protein
MRKLFVLILALSVAQQLTPIPSPADGFFQGPISSNYTMDVFYDHMCSDSKAAYPGLMQYWQANSQWLGLNIHILPLPYHPFSFMVAQAGRFIQQSYPGKFMLFVTYMFNYQNLILNYYQNWDYPTAQQKVAFYTNQATGVATNTVLNALNDNNIYASSQASYQYGASRGMVGAPLYLVNDVWVPEASDFLNATQWSDFFNSLNS